MSNRKKLKSRDGATRIAKSEEFTGLYDLQVYDEKADQWGDIEGCAHLSWKDAAQARKNYAALRRACKVTNGASLHINVPADEVYGK